MNFLKLIRYHNLFLLALMQLIFRFGYLELINIPLSLFYWQYALLVCATVLIAAGGYVINDIFDQETDNENKPEKVIIGKYISESKAYTIYAALTILGVACGFILANSISHPNLAVIFVLVATLLYFYASSLKQIAVLGNVTIAIILAFSVLIIGIFDIFPNTFDVNRQQMTLAFAILWDYAKFAFIINLAREIIKDIEDVNGDNIQGIRTLPVIIGTGKTAKIASLLLFLTAAYIFYYISENLMESVLYVSVAYLLAVVIAPIIFVAILIWNTKELSQFAWASKILKWVIFFGILSVSIITLNIRYHA